MPMHWRWLMVAAGLGLWVLWGWSRLTDAAVPAYGPLAHHLAALHGEILLHRLAGAVLLLFCGWELVRWLRHRWRGGPPASRPAGRTTARSGGIRGGRAETRVHASGR